MRGGGRAISCCRRGSRIRKSRSVRFVGISLAFGIGSIIAGMFWGSFFFVFEGFGIGLWRMGSGFSAFLLLLGRLISLGGCVLRGTSVGVVLRGSALISLLSLLVALYFLRDHDANHLPLENVGEWFVRIVRHIGSRFPASSLSTLRLNWLELGQPLSTLLVTLKTKQ